MIRARLVMRLLCFLLCGPLRVGVAVECDDIIVIGVLVLLVLTVIRKSAVSSASVGVSVVGSGRRAGMVPN